MHDDAVSHSLIELAVLRLGDCWQIIHSGRRWGRFRFKVDAEEAAIRLASRLRREGTAVVILSQGPAGELVALVAA